MDWYFVGADFGQSRDYTAIAVLERAELRGKYDYAVRAYERTVALRLRYLERIPLGTRWTNIQQDDAERMFRQWKAEEERRNGRG